MPAAYDDAERFRHDRRDKFMATSIPPVARKRSAPRHRTDWGRRESYVRRLEQRVRCPHQTRDSIPHEWVQAATTMKDYSRQLGGLYVGTPKCVGDGPYQRMR